MNRDKNRSFFERVYEVVKTIPEGKVATYGQIARAMGTKDARRVGQALHANPYPPSAGQGEGEVPCHRVVTKDGRLAPNFAFDGAGEQRKRLEAEGVKFVDEMHVEMDDFIWKFR